MKIHDLTHLITPGIPVWPGTPQPVLAEGSTMERDGFRETRLELFSHVGTHMDAPAHMLSSGATLDTLPVSAFMGTAWVLDAGGYEGKIPPEALDAFPGADFLLVSTGWEARWNTREYFGAYPTLSAGTVERARPGRARHRAGHDGHRPYGRRGLRKPPARTGAGMRHSRKPLRACPPAGKAAALCGPAAEIY